MTPTEPVDPDAPEIEEALAITVVRADGTVEHIQGDSTNPQHTEAVQAVLDQQQKGTP